MTKLLQTIGMFTVMFVFVVPLVGLILGLMWGTVAQEICRAAHPSYKYSTFSGWYDANSRCKAKFNPLTYITGGYDD